jgi:crotonobetainyl-CoA:carnitine CoA-transferase CaiB-like acyl-CoA transferase
LPDDPQVAALSLLQKTGSDAVLPVVPVAVNHSMADITAVEIPTLGGATTAVLREIGYDEATIAGLREKGVIR